MAFGVLMCQSCTVHNPESDFGLSGCVSPFVRHVMHTLVFVSQRGAFIKFLQKVSSPAPTSPLLTPNTQFNPTCAAVRV